MLIFGFAVLVQYAPTADADCRRVCRAGEIRNAERCCVKKRRPRVERERRQPRANHAQRCVGRRDMKSCAHEGLRLARLKHHERSHNFLAKACASPATPVGLKRRSCFTLAKLVKFGLVKKRGLSGAELMLRACRGVAGSAKCADTDGDGIRNHLDACPTAKEDKDGHKDHDGCPDTDDDSDGVADKKDACPRLWGQAKNGCPKFGRRIGNSFMFVKKSVSLAYALPSTRPRLKALLQILKRNPKLGHLEIRGHAAAGEANHPKLSWQRARAFKKLLVARGVDGKRLRVNAYGGTIYGAPLVDVIVAGPLSHGLSAAQIARGIKEMSLRADYCERKHGPDGSSTWHFWIRANGSTLQRQAVRGVLAGSSRGACITAILRRYRFPKSGARSLTKATLIKKFP